MTMIVVKQPKTRSAVIFSRGGPSLKAPDESG